MTHMTLGRVHGRAAADGDDHIGLEQAHLGGTAASALQGGVGLDIIEAVVRDAHLVKLSLDSAGVAILEQELVGHDEGALLAHDAADFVERHRRGALLEVHLLGSAEPQHVLAALRDGLDVDQVLHPNVLGDGVAAPGAAAQGQGRLHAEVVQVTDAALRGGGVDDDAAGLHGVLEAGRSYRSGRGGRRATRCGPWPPASTRCSALSTASWKSLAWYMARTGRASRGRTLPSRGRSR